MLWAQWLLLASMCGDLAIRLFRLKPPKDDDVDPVMVHGCSVFINVLLVVVAWLAGAFDKIFTGQ